jgi:spermidine synthase
MSVWPIFPLFFLSGIAGLVYQVLWVRQLGNVLGNTTYSASLVTSVFMLGLGLGSYLAGRAIDPVHDRRPRAPLLAYGAIELSIGVLGILLALMLPRLGSAGAAISTYAQGVDGWYELSFASSLRRYLAATVLLAPITLLMGATLTLLVRFVVHARLEQSGMRVGLLYGINTAGAAFGAFLTDFLLVPTLGIFEAQLVAVACNVLAGVGAIVLALHRPADPQKARVEPIASVASPARVRNTAAALFLAGFAAMAFEILWFRHLVAILGGLRAIFSLLLTVILGGIWIGSIFGGWLHRRFGRPELIWTIVQAGLASSTLLLLIATTQEGATAIDFMMGASWRSLPKIAAVVALPSILMGFGYPLANAMVQETEKEIGRRAGTLYFANTLGNVLGALAAGFLLLPAVGIQIGFLIAAVICAVSLIPIHRVHGSRRALAACLSSLAAVFLAWSMLPPDRLLRATLPAPDEKSRIIAVSEGINETLAVEDVVGVKLRLITNGHSMSTTSLSAQRYMRAFVHVPLLHLDAPKRVLVISFGVGNTAHSALLHPSVESLEVADLSRNVLSHADDFESANHGVLKDARTSVFVNDGRHHLSMRGPESYDLITLEPPPIRFAGVCSLYSREFYALAKSRLAKGGFMTQWVPGYQVGPEKLKSLLRAFLDEFPSAILLSGSWHELILVGRKDAPIVISPEDIERRLEAAPLVRADLARISMGTAIELIGSFAATAKAMERVVQDAEPITDDRPLLEYEGLATEIATQMPRELFDVSGVASWCPNCFRDGRPAPSMEGLDRYLEVEAALYRAPAFLHFGGASESGWTEPVLVSLEDPAARRVVQQSKYLSAWVRFE